VVDTLYNYLFETISALSNAELLAGNHKVSWTVVRTE